MEQFAFAPWIQSTGVDVISMVGLLLAKPRLWLLSVLGRGRDNRSWKCVFKRVFFRHKADPRGNSSPQEKSWSFLSLHFNQWESGRFCAMVTGPQDVADGHFKTCSCLCFVYSLNHTIRKHWVPQVSSGKSLGVSCNEHKPTKEGELDKCT